MKKQTVLFLTSLHDMGQPQVKRGHLEKWVHCTKETDQTEPEPGRPTEHSFEVECFSITKSVRFPVAKFVRYQRKQSL